MLPVSHQHFMDRRLGRLAATGGENPLIGEPLLDEPVIFGERFRGAILSQVEVFAAENDQPQILRLVMAVGWDTTVWHGCDPPSGQKRYRYRFFQTWRPH